MSEDNSQRRHVTPGPDDIIDKEVVVEAENRMSETRTGILHGHRMGKIAKKAAAKQLESYFDHQHEYLKVKFSTQLELGTANLEANVRRELKEIAAEDQRMLNELGRENRGLKIANIEAINDEIASKMVEWGEKNWPKQFIDEGLEQLMTLRQEAIDEVIRVLGVDSTGD